LSNSESEFIRDLFKDKEKESKKIQYTYQSLDAFRMINCKGSGRKGAKEILVKNF